MRCRAKQVRALRLTLCRRARRVQVPAQTSEQRARSALSAALSRGRCGTITVLPHARARRLRGQAPRQSKGMVVPCTPAQVGFHPYPSNRPHGSVCAPQRARFAAPPHVPRARAHPQTGSRRCPGGAPTQGRHTRWNQDGWGDAQGGADRAVTACETLQQRHFFCTLVRKTAPKTSSSESFEAQKAC